METSRQHPYLSKIKHRYLLNGNGSSKKTYHVELQVPPHLHYEPGDSIGILPQYGQERVNLLLEQLKSEDIFTFKEKSLPLSVLLTSHINLDTFSKKFLRMLSKHSIEKREVMDQLLDERDACKNFIQSHVVESALDFFKPKELNVQELIDSLSPILPRMYSIASSKLEHEERIHLTIATFSYQKQERQCCGLGSNFLCCCAQIDTTDIPLYVHPSPKFKLPTSHETDIIMIGPGTGVAPYVAFLQERRALDSSGKHWLFFGDRNRSSDYYYEDFFTQFGKTHHLDVDLAFSRDQEEKIYVQHKMMEQKEKLWEWISTGAHLYICGDARQMAQDVQAVLLLIAQSEGKMSPDEAKAFLLSLKKTGKLSLDVY